MCFKEVAVRISGIQAIVQQIRYKIQPVSVKKNFVLRLDEETYKTIEKWASDEFRSVNGQIEWLLDKAIKQSGRGKTSDKASRKDAKK